jgi:hypothetical protein
MHQALFPVAGESEFVDAFVPDYLGVYQIHVLKQSVPEVFPVKASDSGLGGHLWDYEGEFDITVTSVLLLDFWHYGGQCIVKKGLVFKNAKRGILTTVIEVFKKIKQEEDVFKKIKSPQYNQARREMAKLMLNSLSGKFIQKPCLDEFMIMRDVDQREKYIRSLPSMIDNLAGKVREQTLEDLSFCSSVPIADNTMMGELYGEDTPHLIRSKKPFSGLFEEGSKFHTSTVLGIFIYSWSQHHIVNAILAPMVRAKAAYATETDSMLGNRLLFEQYQLQQGHANPYDTSAPIINDKTMAMSANVLLLARPLGYLYCPALASVWAKTNGKVWTPSREGTDFGDMSCESGIHNGEFVQTTVAFIGKKCYYVSDFETQIGRAHV